MDWTEFDADGHSTVMLSMVTRHGRSTPLVWLTVDKGELKGRRNEYERRVLQRLRETLPSGVEVTVLADRGFGDHKLYEYLEHILGFGYVIRFKGNIQVTNKGGEMRLAREWVGQGGRARTLRQAQVTQKHYLVNTVVCVHSKGVKKAWCLAASDAKANAKSLMTLYAKRWGVESSFRDTKDLRFGMGMKAVHVRSVQRRDRLWLLNAFAVSLLTLLGAAGESLGYDRRLKANTVKTRTHSLFRQGALLYKLLVNMPEDRFRPLRMRFGEMIKQQPTFSETFSFI